MDQLAVIIQEYESDTFSASRTKITEIEATIIAEQLIEQLCEIVSEGGSMYCDGVLLNQKLSAIREHMKRTR